MSGAVERQAAPPLVRDFTTWLIYAQSAIFGYFLYALSPTIALLRDEQGYTRSVASLHGSAMAVGSIIAGLLAARIVRRIGRGPMLRLGSFGIIGGLLIYTGFSPLAVTLLGAFVAMVGGTLIMVGVNAFLPDHHGPASPRAMTEAHGLATLVGLLGPLAIGLGVATAVGWRAGLLVACVGLVVVEVVRGRHLEPFDGPHGHPDDEAGHAPKGPLPRLFWPALFVFGCTVGTEFCLLLWGSDLLRDRAGMGEAAAAAALVTVVGGMALGRLGGGPVVSRLGAEQVLAASMVVAMVGFALVWVSTSSGPMLVGLAVTGIGLGLQSPLAIGRAVFAADGQVDRGAGLTSVAAGLASGIAPFALAAVADSVGVHAAFLLVPVLSVVALVLVRIAPVHPDGL